MTYPTSPLYFSCCVSPVLASACVQLVLFTTTSCDPIRYVVMLMLHLALFRLYISCFLCVLSLLFFFCLCVFHMFMPHDMLYTLLLSCSLLWLLLRGCCCCLLSFHVVGCYCLYYIQWICCTHPHPFLRSDIHLCVQLLVVCCVFVVCVSSSILYSSRCDPFCSSPDTYHLIT